MKTIGIFRNQLFKGSEVFIKQQTEAITQYSKCYIGRRFLGKKTESSKVYVLNENNSPLEKFMEVLNALTVMPSAYSHVLKNQSLDIIHAHFAIDGIYGLALAQSKNIPLVTTLHGFDVTVTNKELLASRSPAWINYLLRQEHLKKKGDKFICVSNFIANQALRNGFPENKLIQHYIGIDVDLYQKRNTEQDCGVILHVARLVEKKGTSVLINAIKIVKHKLKEVKLVIIGDGPLLATLCAQVSALGLNENVVFTGSLEHGEVMAWMQKTSMLVLPSLTAKTGDAEGLGMVILEAAVTGVPVIGTKHGGISEAIIDEKTGYLVEERNEEQLAEKILYLLNNFELRNELGLQARSFVKEKFNLSVQTKKLENIYQELIHG